MQPKYILAGTCVVLAFLIIASNSGMIQIAVIPNPVESVSVIIITESEDRTPEQAIVLASQEIRRLFDQGEWLLIDQDTTVIGELADFVSRAKMIGLPVIFLLDQDRKTIYEGALPETVESFVSVVNKAQKGG